MTKYTTAADGPSPATIDGTTVLSLLAALSLLIAAYGISNVALSKSTGVKLRLIFIWHLFDALVHFIFEGSFLYHCFFTHVPGANLNGFLGEPGRLYGAAYGTSPTARLWQEYAKADARWGGADLTVISIELLTVFVAGPLAAYICDCICRESFTMWFWVIVLATGEIYGGFMTFSPEWLSQSPNLDTSNFMYLYVYLAFFNLLWVVFPAWMLYEAYSQIVEAFRHSSKALQARSSRQKKIS